MIWADCNLIWQNRMYTLYMIWILNSIKFSSFFSSFMAQFDSHHHFPPAAQSPFLPQ